MISPPYTQCITCHLQIRGGQKGQSGSSRSSSVMSSCSATPGVSHAPACIIISSDDSTDSGTARKKDPEFVPEQPMKKEKEGTLSSGVLVGSSSDGAQGGFVPKPPPVSSEYYYFSSRI